MSDFFNCDNSMNKVSLNPHQDYNETAEIAKFSPEEKEQYEESLKSYRDLKNVIDKSYGDGKKDGVIEEKVKGIIKSLKRGKLTIEEIAEDFSTTVDFVIQVRKEQNL